MAKGLGAEINKRGAFDSAEEEAYLNLARTRSVLEGGVAGLLKGEGLTESSYNVLRILRGWKGRAESGEADARRGGVRTCGEVLREMVVRAADVTRLIDRLESKGLVRRHSAEGDGRVVLVGITARGERVVERLDGPLAAVHREQLGHLSAEELSALTRLLERAREGAGG